MSISVNGKWEGVSFKRCEQDQSFVNGHILRRYKQLKLENGYILLTWKLADHPGTHATRFFLNNEEPIGGESICEDFILGQKCCDEAFNIGEAGTSANKGRKRIYSRSCHQQSRTIVHFRL